jgi:hypothetical protein
MMEACGECYCGDGKVGDSPIVAVDNACRSHIDYFGLHGGQASRQEALRTVFDEREECRACDRQFICDFSMATCNRYRLEASSLSFVAVTGSLR